MIIKRVIHGEEVAIELTHDELYLAYEAYEHHCDYEYVKNELEGGALRRKPCSPVTPSARTEPSRKAL